MKSDSLTQTSQTLNSKTKTAKTQQKTGSPARADTCTEEAPKFLQHFFGICGRKPEGFQVLGLSFAHRGYIGVILGLHRDNGKENGNYYSGFEAEALQF